MTCSLDGMVIIHGQIPTNLYFLQFSDKQASVAQLDPSPPSSNPAWGNLSELTFLSISGIVAYDVYYKWYMVHGIPTAVGEISTEY